MEPTDLQRTRSVDVTGLPEDAIRVVESLVTLLRREAGEVKSLAFSSPEKWIKAIREWAASHKPEASSADWSRESIYAGRGE